MAELHGDAFRHAPLLREHVAVLLLVVQQLSLDPGVPSIDLVQPGDLERSVIVSFHLKTRGSNETVCDDDSRLGFPGTTPGTPKGAA